MFSSGNTNDPFSYTNEALFGNSFANEANPNSSEQEPSSLFFPLPSPLPDETLVEGSGAKAINNINTGTELMGINDCPKKISNGPTNPNPTRKTGRKDRHSKICTAHGLRDRRMRLSVQTARKFFDLQDMLGFDKASETIEWLFSKSKPAIREAARSHSPVKGGCSRGRESALFSSKCDDGSDMEETGHEEDGRTGKSDISTFVEDRKSIRKSQRGSSGENGSSEIARAGARERRREKLIPMSVEEPNQHLLSNPSNLEQFHWNPLESPSGLEQLGRPWSPFKTADEWMMGSTENSKQYLDGNPSDLEQLGPWSPFETADESCSNSHERNSAVGLVAHVEEPSPHSVEHQLATMGMFETFLGTASSSTLPSVFDLQNNLVASDGEESNNTFLGPPEYWDMHCERINPDYCPTNMDPIFTGNNIILEQNPNPNSSFDFESHFMGSFFSCRPFDGNDNHSLG